jgi:hypothetical protein
VPRLGAAAILALLLSVPVAVQQAVLPDQQAFFGAVRENLERAARVQDEFAYKERRTQIHTNPFGRLGTGGVLVYQLTPLPNGPGYTRRVLERDGKPVVGGEVDRIGERRNRTRDRAQSPSAIDDTLNVLDFSIDRRETVAARAVIVVKFAPKPNARPRTREGRLARSFTGEIRIDEQAQEIMRVDAVAVDSLSYGYGIVARLGEGTRVTLVREPVEQQLWLPVSIRFKGEGRAMLVRKLNIDFAVEWFDYRRVLPADAR